MKGFVQPNALSVQVTLRMGTAKPVLTEAQAADARRRELTEEQYARAFQLQGEAAESITLRVRPWPLAFLESVKAACPPDFFVGVGPGADAEREKIAAEHDANVINWITLGHALRDELTAKLPSMSDRGALIAYARAVRAEIETAGLVEGHLYQLKAAIIQANRGIGDLGNG